MSPSKTASKPIVKKAPSKALSSRKVTTTPKPNIAKTAIATPKPSKSLNKNDIEKLFRELIRKEFARLGIVLADDEEKEEKDVEDGKDDKEENNSNPKEKEVDDPMDIDIADIDLVRLENAKELLAMDGKVEGSEIQVLADTCANTSFLPESLAKELNMDIDSSIVHRLTGASGENLTAGMVRDVLIELAPGCVIKEDLVVLKVYKHREIGLSRACLRRYNYDVLESREHIPLTCNGKNFFIPIVLDKNRSKEIEE